MLVQNFIYSNPAVLSSQKDRIDSVGLELDYFSQLFGRYAFWKEKYGHCMAPMYGGAQENQTMTTITDFDVLDGVAPPHELGHHWWGDHVTCGTWKDVWLNEGFASYCEYLFIEHFRGKAAASAHMLMKHYDPQFGVTAQVKGSTYVNDTTNAARIFDTRLTYYKGEAVVHMLRYLAPDDSTFFAALRSYRQRYAFRTAITDSFRMAIEPFYKPSLDTFFNEWIYGEGYPRYYVRWNQVGGNTFIVLRQDASYPSVTPLFHLPVEVKLSGTSGDTTIRIWMSDTTGYAAFAWNNPVSSVTVDPSDWIPHITKSVVQDATLGVTSTSHAKLSVAPNPTHSEWKVSGIAAGNWTLYDVTGRMLRKGVVAQAIMANDLTPGIYMLQVDAGGKKVVVPLVRD
jgi:aminopeptidase N